MFAYIHTASVGKSGGQSVNETSKRRRHQKSFSRFEHRDNGAKKKRL